MTGKVSFYRCDICGNLVELINIGGGELVCCGQPMRKLEANTTDAAQEKHVPVIEKGNGNIIVKVGEAPHPMTEDHYIQWITMVTDKYLTRCNLKPGDDAVAAFSNVDKGTIYAYCNLHGLWKADF